MRRRLALIFPGIIVTLLFSPRDGLAWIPGGTEGSYVHQTAHLLFMGAMLFFIYEMHREGLHNYRGFRFLIWACWLLVLWNLDAFVGHWSEWSLTNPVIMGHALSQRLLMEDFNTWLFYLTKISHFVLLVPIFYLFYRGLQAFARESPPGPP